MCRNFDCNVLLWRAHAFIVQYISETIMAISQSAWMHQGHCCKCIELMEFISVTYSWGRIRGNFDQFMHLQFGLQLWALAIAELSSWAQMGLDSIRVRSFQKKIWTRQCVGVGNSPGSTLSSGLLFTSLPFTMAANTGLLAVFLLKIREKI